MGYRLTTRRASTTKVCRFFFTFHEEVLRTHSTSSGITREMMLSHFRGEIIYQAETDVHFPHLTVGQTLMFAAMARTPKNRVPGLTREQYAEQMRNVVMTIFGLTHTVDTKLGNDYVRGVSGGERKRVSIAEVILSQSPLQCWDNSTRGLDSASALQFVHTLKLAGDMTGATTVVALYQASEDAYNVGTHRNPLDSRGRSVLLILTQ